MPEDYILPAEVETLDALEEPFRPYYRETQGGKFALRLEDDHPTIRSLRNETSRREKLRKEKEKLEAELGETRSRLEELESLHAQDPEEGGEGEGGEVEGGSQQSGDTKKELAQLRAERMRLDRQLKKLEEEKSGTAEALAAARQELERHKISSVITRITAGEKGAFETALPDLISFAMQSVARDDDGSIITDDEGDPVFSDGNGTHLTAKEFDARVLREKKPHCYRAVGGAGATGKRSTAPVTDVRAKSDLKTDRQKIEWATKHGWDAYNALPSTRN